MLRHFVSGVLLCCAATSGWSQVESPLPFAAPVQKVFIPSGYDDNDVIQVMLSGDFPDGCYRVSKVSVATDKVNNTIVITAEALKYTDPNRMCIQAVTTFLENVRIGLLNEGIHKIIVNPKAQAIAKTLDVGKRNSDLPDDYIYAPIKSADIIVHPETRTQAVRIEGKYPHLLTGCTKIVEIRQLRDADDLLTVLPIMAVFPDEQCQGAKEDFIFEKPLDIPFTQKGLLHVRQFGSGAFTKIVN